MKAILTMIVLCVSILSSHAQGRLTFVQDLGRRGWWYASTQRIMAADDFVFSGNTVVDTVTWWSPAQPGIGDTFDITFYDDKQGVPGSTLSSAQLQVVPTPDRGHFLYTASLPSPVVVEGGVKYWLSVAHTSNREWVWSMTIHNDPFSNDMWCAYRTGPDQDWTRSYSTDLAFALNTVPEASTWATLLVGLGILAAHRKLRR